MRFSYSQVSTYEQCPYKWKLRYKDGLQVERYPEADDALLLGTALHRGIETDVETAIKEYKSNFPVMDQEIYDEMLKLEYWIPKVKAILPPGGMHEKPIYAQYFVGYIDYLVPTGDGRYDIYDFKYSNNIDSYMESGQLSVYEYFTRYKIRDCYFVFVPKIKLPIEDTSNMGAHWKELYRLLDESQITVQKMPFSALKLTNWMNSALTIQNVENFPKHESNLCYWCEYKDYCKKGLTYMLLPKNERRNISATPKRRFWFYGPPFSGKTYLANQFPEPLMLNTDGNVNQVDAQFIPIIDEYWMEGRIEKSKFGWQTFKEVVTELYKNEPGFKTVVVDLVEDLYLSCRRYVCKQNGVDHESDKSMVMWDKVRSEFFSEMKRLMNAPIDNIILISHLDDTRDIMQRDSTNTKMTPAIQDKVMKKLEGMVQLVGRTYKSGSKYYMSFRSDSYTVGGARFPLSVDKIESSYDNLMKVVVAGEKAQFAGMGKTETKTETSAPEEQHVKTEEQAEETPAAEPVAEEKPKRTRRTRKVRTEE